MNNLTNKYLISIFVLASLLTTSVNAQVDSSFNYQGELLDNNSPANDSYDFLFNLTDSDGLPFGDPSEHLNTDVVNGLFSLNVDFNVDAYDGFGDVSFSIEIRRSSDGGAYTSLGSQTIQSVPLATNLTNGDAITGEVLTFNGFQWAPSTPAGSPWSLTGSNLSYTAGNIGIGTASPAADLMIDADDQSEALRVRINTATKLSVNQNGGTALGSFTTPPSNGLFVNGDAKQPISSNGLMKYMAYVNCGSNSSVIRQYNGVNSSSISVTGSNVGRCVIDFPADISNRFWQVSINYAAPSPSQRTANCRLETGSTDKLLCNVVVGSSDNSFTNGFIMVMVY